MTIQWRGYQITRDDFNWILSLSTESTKEGIDLYEKLSGKKAKAKPGDIKLEEVGYFHTLDQLMAVVIRYETGKMDGEVRLGEFIIMWNNILKEFKEEIEVRVEGVEAEAICK